MYLSLVSTNNNSNIDVELFYDVKGNMFVLFNDKYYKIYIDKNDNLTLELINNIGNLYDISDVDYKFNSIKHTFDPSSLKGKILNEIDNTDNVSEESFDDDNNDYNNNKINLKYYPEDKYYYTENNADNCSDDEQFPDGEDAIFNISNFNEMSYVEQLYKTFDSPSIYDTIIIDNKLSDNSIVFTLECDTKLPYRLTINTSGLFMLNLVGLNMKYFNLHYNDTSSNIDFVPLK